MTPVDHPSGVDRAVRRWLDATLGPDDPVCVACSGGADSLALALAVRAVAGRRPTSAVTVDHGLQDGSADRARTTATVLRDMGYSAVDVRTVRVDGPGGPEAAARRARYAALAESVRPAGPAAAVLLAHTADDQAETVLLGLARGSGPRSLAGMRAWRPPWGRPLLGVRRADTERRCAEAGLTPWQDPHNLDPAYTRVRVRREVMPLLDEVLGGGVVAALARTAELTAQDTDALDELARARLSAHADPAAGASTGDGPVGGAVTIGCDRLVGEPTAVRRRMLRAWLADAGAGPLTHEHLTRVDALTRPGPAGSAVRVPPGLDVTRRAGRLVLTPVVTGHRPG
ncbi:tRNA lysidine(34) synthetase TilS [Nakamurella flavida]|uniref:tRNA(Ile)-lysidine synthase n=1 Tax=Nakamurella flavida TaxID=363630 RepID=A0A938YJG3_9ACTN|nr:tRNA lysidine(34) synthetase TilS [Nakamurella flavida]MBM9475721.1 tRNA lysidine(34) synthetase TilS [Nakamurella flavida]MDP9778001.1 tRNA(Ile)-lysidine synthase [Nakamurella flavida]